MVIPIAKRHKKGDRRMEGEEDKEESTAPLFWCNVCKKDLQSRKCFEEHVQGRKHLKKALHLDPKAFKSNDKIRFSYMPYVDESIIFEKLNSLAYRNVVVLTGAGVSTAAGIPDFRSPGGLFETIRDRFGEKFPFVHDCPEILLSRSFAMKFPQTFQKEVTPILEHIGTSYNALPTHTHKFCKWLDEKGILRRVYTQNVDGLHLHPSLGMDSEKVVECHGSMRENNLVLYGDGLPKRFYKCCNQDFSQDNKNGPVDLLIVFGTSLQVLPFKAIPNLAPRGCTRVLVNRIIADCNDASGNRDEYGSRLNGAVRVGDRHVTTRNLWMNRDGNKKWSQLLVESDCDDFINRFLEAAKITWND